MFGFNAATTTTLAMLALVAVVTVRGAYNEQNWGFQSYLNEHFTLACNHSDLVVESGNYIEWKLPSGVLLNNGTPKYVLNNKQRVINMELSIQNVKESDKGVYVCHVYTDYTKSTSRGQLLRGLNLGGHKYREPFDEYRDNLMVGGLAALVLFVPLVTVCLVYKFRYQTKEQRAVKHAARLEATRHQRYLEANGKGAELYDVAVVGEKGASNAAYEVMDEMGTRL